MKLGVIVGVNDGVNVIVLLGVNDGVNVIVLVIVTLGVNDGEGVNDGLGVICHICFPFKYACCAFFPLYRTFVAVSNILILVYNNIQRATYWRN